MYDELNIYPNECIISWTYPKQINQDTVDIHLTDQDSDLNNLYSHHMKRINCVINWSNQDIRWRNQYIVINNQCQMLSQISQFTQDEVDSNCLRHNPTEAISLYDDDDDVKEISDWESSFDPASHPVSDPGHVPTPEPSNNLNSIPYPNPIPQPSSDPGPDPICNTINQTFRSSVIIEDCDGYLATERLADHHEDYQHTMNLHDLQEICQGEIKSDFVHIWNNYAYYPSLQHRKQCSDNSRDWINNERFWIQPNHSLTVHQVLTQILTHFLLQVPFQYQDQAISQILTFLSTQVPNQPLTVILFPLLRLLTEHFALLFLLKIVTDT